MLCTSVRALTKLCKHTFVLYSCATYMLLNLVANHDTKEVLYILM